MLPWIVLKTLSSFIYRSSPTVIFLCASFTFLIPTTSAKAEGEKPNLSSEEQDLLPGNEPVTQVFEYVSELYRRGEEYYEQGNFLQAIQKWNEAFNYLPASDEYKAWQANLLYFLSFAHMQYYEQTKDPKQLEIAKQKIDQYLNLLGANDAESRSAAQQQKIEIYHLLLEHENHKLMHNSPPNQIHQIPIENSSLPKKHAQSSIKKFWILGGVSSGVGLALLGVMAYGSVAYFHKKSEYENWNPINEGYVDSEQINEEGDSMLQKAKTMEKLAWGTGISGGILIVGGITTLIVGAVKRKASIKPQREVNFSNSRIIFYF